MQTLEPTNPATTPEIDLTAAIRRVLENSPEPLTLSKIRAGLPAKQRVLSLEELGDHLRRQVAASVLLQYPKYRSQQDRYWDRPMRVHIVELLKSALTEKPLALSELRRKLPDYAKAQFEEVMQDEVNSGRLYRHPPAGSRGGPRFGAEPPSPRSYLMEELSAVFDRLEKLGFTEPQLRQCALELLHEEEWAPVNQPSSPEAEQEPVLYAATESATSIVEPS